MGMNLKHPDHPAHMPAYRENTVESFLRAAEAGATFVEFDVQVTLFTLLSAASWHSAKCASAPQRRPRLHPPSLLVLRKIHTISSCHYRNEQVTKDGVPVLWHDDAVVWRQAGGGVASTPIASLTLADFKRLLVRDPATLTPILFAFRLPRHSQALARASLQ